ncbi:MAG: hypothetical protein WBQ62_05925 [Dehalococcoidales bacterium]
MKRGFALILSITLVLSIFMSIFLVAPVLASGPTAYTLIQTGFTINPSDPGVSIENGSIIHHYMNGEVEILNPSGIITMRAKDSSSGLVLTPEGMKKADDVYMIPNHANVATSSDGHVTKVFDKNNQLVLTIIDDRPISQINNNHTNVSIPQGNGNILETCYSTNVQQFLAYFTVPTPPQNSNDIDAYWSGIQDNSNSLYFIQSCVMWNNVIGGTWSIASCQTSGNGILMSNVVPVSQGQTICFEQVYYNGSWEVITFDENSGLGSWANETGLGETNDSIYTSLETYDIINGFAYPGTNPTDMPGSDLATSVTLFQSNGASAPISWAEINPYGIPLSTAQVTWDTNAGSWIYFNTHH